MSVYSFESKKVNPSKGFEFSFCRRQNENRYTQELVVQIAMTKKSKNRLAVLTLFRLYLTYQIQTEINKGGAKRRLCLFRFYILSKTYIAIFSVQLQKQDSGAKCRYPTFVQNKKPRFSFCNF